MDAFGVKPMYTDYEPSLIEWKSEEGCDTLLVSLPDFTKDQLRVQLTTSRTLKISGQRPLGNNTWSRFQREFPVSANCDTQRINARLDNGTLIIRQPKIITPADEQEDKQPKPTMQTEPAKPQIPSKDPPPPPPKPSLDKQGNEKAKTAEKEKEPIARATANEKAKIAEKEKEAIIAGATANEKAKTAEKEKEAIIAAKTAENQIIARAADEKAKTEPANRKSSISTSDVTKKTVEKSTEGSAKGRNAMEKARVEHEKFSDAADGRGVSGYMNGVLQKCKQVVSGQFMELKKPSNLTKFAAAVVLALAFGFYLTNWVRSSVKSKQD